jgi:hypothetical protein
MITSSSLRRLNHFGVSLPEKVSGLDLEDSLFGPQDSYLVRDKEATMSVRIKNLYLVVPYNSNMDIRLKASPMASESLES